MVITDKETGEKISMNAYDPGFYSIRERGTRHDNIWSMRNKTSVKANVGLIEIGDLPGLTKSPATISFSEETQTTIFKRISEWLSAKTKTWVPFNKKGMSNYIVVVNIIHPQSNRFTESIGICLYNTRTHYMNASDNLKLICDEDDSITSCSSYYGIRIEDDFKKSISAFIDKIIKNMLDWFSSNGYLALSKTDKSKLTMKCIMKPDANHYMLDSLSDDPVLIAIPKKMLGKNIETSISKQIVQRGTKNINTEYLVSLTDPKQNVLKNNENEVEETSYSARFSLRFGTDNKECLSFIEANPCLKNSATQGKTEEDVLIDCLKN
jgi:hypothetical protein